jgi:hypothetical protein
MKKKKKQVRRKSKGLGDSIEKITKATGIKKAVSFIFGEDCGCDERKEWLNKKFPYKNVECLNEDEYWYLDEWFKHNKQTVSYNDRKELIKIYNRVLNKKQKDTRCGSCVKDIINSLKNVYNAYLTNDK